MDNRFIEVKVTGMTPCRRYVAELEAKGLSKVVSAEPIPQMVEVITWDKNWNPVSIFVEKI